MGRLGRAELVAAVGGVLLAAGIFLPWYRTDPDNANAQIDGATGALSGWDVHPLLRWLLLAAATAPFILVWIVIRASGSSPTPACSTGRARRAAPSTSPSASCSPSSVPS
jgi:hypothetical protein